MNDDHSPRETRAAAKARRREEAEIRNAKPRRELMCGHVTTLDADTHAARCGAARKAARR